MQAKRETAPGQSSCQRAPLASWTSDASSGVGSLWWHFLSMHCALRELATATASSSVEQPQLWLVPCASNAHSSWVALGWVHKRVLSYRLAFLVGSSCGW